MQLFQALKQVTATPMSRQAYNDLRGWIVPDNENGSDDGYLIEDVNVDTQPNFEGYNGYISWEPKDKFDSQFHAVKQGACTAPQDPDHILTDAEILRLSETGTLCDCAEVIQMDGECPIEAGDVFDFGSAIYLLKIGKKVMRKGWNGKGMFLYYVPAASYPMQRNSLKTMDGAFPDNMVPYGAYIAMKTAQNNVVPWLASQTDMLGTDWTLFDDNAH